MNSLLDDSGDPTFTDSKVNAYKFVLHAFLVAITVLTFYITLNYMVLPQTVQTFSAWTRSISNGSKGSGRILAELNHSRLSGKNKSARRPFICTSSACQAAARTMMNSLNHSVDPCADFYQFVCSRWITEHPLGRLQLLTSADHVGVRLYLDMLKKKLSGSRAIPSIKFLYKSCLQGNDSLFSSLVATFMYTTGLENWPYTTTSVRGLSREDVSYKIGAVYRELGIDCLFLFAIDKDPSNSSKEFLAIEQPHLVTGPGWKADAEYYSGLSTVYTTLKKILDRSGSSDIAGIERQIQSSRETPLHGCSEMNRCDVVKVAHLPALEFLNWTALIRGVTGVEGDDTWGTVKIKSPKYLLNLFKDFEPRTADILNYLVFRTMMVVFPLISGEKFPVLAEWITRNEPDRPLQPSREDQCLRFMNEIEPYVPMTLAKDVVAKRISSSLVKEVRRSLPLAFLRHVQREIPLPGRALDNFVEDIKNMGWDFFYPDGLRDTDVRKRYLDGIYTNNPRSPATFFYYYYIKNSVQKRRLAANDPWAAWTMDLFSSWPRLDPPYRALQIPAAAFDLFLPRDNIVDVFQLPKIAYRVYYNLFRFLYLYIHTEDRRNLSALAITFFGESRKCLAKQYQEISHGVSSESTALNDLLDVLSVRLSLEVFRSEIAKVATDVRLLGAAEYTSDQLFFVRYAMSFCENAIPGYVEKRQRMGLERPAWIRVNGALRNVPEFHQAFRCKPSAETMCFP